MIRKLWNEGLMGRAILAEAAFIAFLLLVIAVIQVGKWLA